MAEFRKLSKEAVDNLLRKKEQGRGMSQRERIIQAYMEKLKELAPGEGLEITLEKGENRQTVKNRLLRAAKRLGIKIEFIRSRNVIRLYRTE